MVALRWARVSLETDTGEGAAMTGRSVAVVFASGADVVALTNPGNAVVLRKAEDAVVFVRSVGVVAFKECVDIVASEEISLMHIVS